MADEKVYEQRLTNAIVNLLREQENVNKFLTAVRDKLSIQASIAGRIAQLTGVSATEAETYIDVSTGKFKGGRRMTSCTDNQLKQLFAKLEEVTSEVHKYPYRLGADAKAAVHDKLNKMSQEVNEIKRVFGEAKYKEIATRAKATAIKTTGIAF